MNLLQLLATGAPPPPTYVEDVFSAFTYTGTGASQSIVNGIDLSTKGGMVWSKGRDVAQNNNLHDTARGVNNYIVSDGANTEANPASNTVTAFNSNGYSIGASSLVNQNTFKFVGWTFAKQSKFFDIVTYTGNGANRTISHNLGAVPGMILVKDLTSANAWKVYHRSLTSNAYYLVLNTTAAEASDATVWNSTTADASVFSLGTHADVNTNTNSYVAYLFGHDTSATGLIQCGSFTTDGSGIATVTLGWEPQFVLVKKTGGATNWITVDISRGLTATPAPQQQIWPNSSSAESSDNFGSINATGFSTQTIGASSTFIYLAIRRGPMKLPTAGTQVYNAIARTGTGAAATVTGVGFPPDLVFGGNRTYGMSAPWCDKLRGVKQDIASGGTLAEATDNGGLLSFDMDGMSIGNDAGGTWLNVSGRAYINWCLRRYPGVFDEVCYTGTGSAHTEAHNLTVVPELMIVKKRSAADAWYVYHANNTANPETDYLILNTTAATADLDTIWNDTAPTSTVFTVGTHDDVNQSTGTFVTYLFATLAGISKCGTYTGNGSNQTINCGFAAGARFVLIKRTDSTGNWVVFDSTRGIVAGNDPYLLLNSTAAEDTDEDAVDTDNSGFVVNETTAANVNTNTATYVYLAFA